MAENLLTELKMVDDNDTAYDEVINDIWSLTFKYTKDEKAKALIRKKCGQLMRLLGDNDSDYGDD